MKQIMILMLIIFSSTLFGATLEVAADGSKPYTTIQSAINATSNGDIVQVYPGTYRENIDFNHHSITLQSLYATTQDTAYIHNTRIIGQPATSAIKVLNEIVVTIDGFTIMNNEQNSNNFNPNGAGGGIYVLHATATIKNNIITNCIAATGGGGVCISYSSALLENNKIFNCITGGGGGGIGIAYNSVSTFSSTSLNSIYNNHASYGMDVLIQNGDDPYVVYLDQCSKEMDTIDQYFVVSNNTLGHPSPLVEVHINRGLLPTINHDLYVSPEGNDNNSGLTAEDAFKTIDYATRVIASDSLNPKTIHLAAGTYSRSTGQIFPCNIPVNVKFIGAGRDATIIDDEHVSRTIVAAAEDTPGNCEISDLSVINTGNANSSFGSLGTTRIKGSVTIKNIKLTSDAEGMGGFLGCANSDMATISNIEIKKVDTPFKVGIDVYRVQKAILNNIIMDSTSCMTNSGDNRIICDEVKQATVNNVAITNSSSSSEGDAFGVAYSDEFCQPNTDGIPHIVNNLLIINNFRVVGYFDCPMAGIGDTSRVTYVNNCTFANNRGNHYMLGSISKVIINNSILYNPEIPYELQLYHEVGYPVSSKCDITLNNSLMMDGINKVNFHDTNPNQLHMNNIITGSPQFKGQTDSSLSPATWAYYQLAEGSPCINAGTPDTTGLCLPRLDLAGCQRVWDGRIDMGCFEYGATDNEDHEVTAVNDYGLTNFPNPMVASQNDATIISFNYPTRAEVEPEIEIYNAKGQKVRTLKTGVSFLDLMEKAGVGKESTQYVKGHNYSVVWDGRNENNRQVSSGVYLYRAKVGNKILQTKKLLILQ